MIACLRFLPFSDSFSNRQLHVNIQHLWELWHCADMDLGWVVLEFGELVDVKGSITGVHMIFWGLLPSGVVGLSRSLGHDQYNGHPSSINEPLDEHDAQS